MEVLELNINGSTKTQNVKFTKQQTEAMDDYLKPSSRLDFIKVREDNGLRRITASQGGLQKRHHHHRRHHHKHNKRVKNHRRHLHKKSVIPTVVSFRHRGPLSKTIEELIASENNVKRHEIPTSTSSVQHDVTNVKRSRIERLPVNNDAAKIINDSDDDENESNEHSPKRAGVAVVARSKTKTPSVRKYTVKGYVDNVKLPEKTVKKTTTTKPTKPTGARAVKKSGNPLEIKGRTDISKFLFE